MLCSSLISGMLTRSRASEADVIPRLKVMRVTMCGALVMSFIVRDYTRSRCCDYSRQIVTGYSGCNPCTPGPTLPRT